MSAMVNSNPMLEVPGWLDKAMLPKEPIVVKALKTIALGVDVLITSSSFSRSAKTRCIELAIPSPNRRGKTITLAKLKGKFNKTEADIVNKEAKIRGVKIKTSSRKLLVKLITNIIISVSVIILALAKELLGIVRSKYGNIPIPNAEVSMAGETLRAEATAEKEQLIEQLRENLEQTSRKALLEAQKDESEFQQETLKKVPYPIYIG